MTEPLKSSFFSAATPLVFGHRGTAGDRPENTLPSFDKALADGADVLETDLHITKDGHIVLMHDENLARCTNGSGDIKDHTLAELKQLDAAYNFSTDGGQTFPYRGQGITIPTLEEVFDRYPGVRFNMDLKSPDPALGRKVADLLKSRGRDGITIIGSFDHVTIEAFRKYSKELGMDVLTCASNVEIGAVVFSNKTRLGRTVALETPVKKSRVTILSEAFVKAAHAQGHVVVPWTINDPQEMKKLLDMGVDGIITDFPKRAAEIIRQRKSGPSAA